MEKEIMGSIKNKFELISEFENKITKLLEKLSEQASKVSEKKMKYPESDMISFSNEDNWNFKEYKKTENEIKDLQKQLEKLKQTP